MCVARLAVDVGWSNALFYGALLVPAATAIVVVAWVRWDSPTAGLALGGAIFACLLVATLGRPARMLTEHVFQVRAVDGEPAPASPPPDARQVTVTKVGTTGQARRHQMAFVLLLLAVVIATYAIVET